MASEFTKITRLLFEAGMLRLTIRSHALRLYTSDRSDNIAAHSFRTALIGWFLAKSEKADPYKVFVMAALHDFPETRTGDINWVQRAYVFEQEKKAAKEQFAGLSQGEPLLELLLEYQEGKTLSAKLTDDADHLDQLILQKEHAHTGNREAELWLHLDDFENSCQAYKSLHTESARKLAKEIVNQEPGEWCNNLWIKKKRKLGNPQ